MSEGMERLPSDLDRVGDDLVAAAERAIVARRRRAGLAARTAATGVAALIAAAALLPGALGPGTRAPSDLALVRAPAVAVPVGCDQPRSRRVVLPACAAGDPIRLGRPRRW
jgi:hypothetical protein